MTEQNQQHILGRLIFIVDEIGPGQYAMDISSTMHCSKVAVIALTLFKNSCAAVEDDQMRREVIKKFDDIADIVTGTVKPQGGTFPPPPTEENDQIGGCL